MAFIAHGFSTATRAFPSTRRILHTTCPRMLSKGDKMPMDVDLMVLEAGNPTPVSTSTLFSSKKVAMVTVPGALTSTCQNGHIPLWVKASDELKAKGVDDVVCLSVNDPFVMDVFEKAVSGTGKVKFIADGGAELTKKLGIDIDTGGFGGTRAFRGCYLIEDGVFTQVNLEEGTSFEGPSKPETLLAQL
eukprot:GFKZ01003147.1.p1 GENE.GFKZ01003147.1~~GFKZ01003147.1.p1  ORF type:complete len:202 (+),score=28.60 GFKZ01003147.1:40-606(+)